MSTGGARARRPVRLAPVEAGRTGRSGHRHRIAAGAGECGIGWRGSSALSQLGVSVRRPAFWLAFAAFSIFSAVVAVRYFPRAFSIVALEITMDREQALAQARDVMGRESLGPAGYRQAASFTLDEEAQTFIELEGGGKDAFTAMMRSRLYSAYTWRVRQFKEGEPHETTIRFTPEGRLYGFVEKLKEDAPGPALDANSARGVAEG